MASIIFHADLDAFFASVEELLDPSLRESPLIVSGYSMRTVVAAANYLARGYGVKAGEPVNVALTKCPGARVVPPHFREYEKYSRKFIRVLETRVSPLTEAASIDECFLDMSSIVKDFSEAITEAERLKLVVKEQLGLSVSVGIGPNRVLAKIATDMNKPYGTTLLTESEVQTKLWPMPVGKIPGIGKMAKGVLEEARILTIGDLARCPDLDQVRALLGKSADYFYAAAWGRGDATIHAGGDDPKSISASITLVSDVADYSELRAVIANLCEGLAYRLRVTKMYGTGVSIALKDSGFTTRGKSRIVEGGVHNEKQLFDAACSLFSVFWKSANIRLVSVSVYGLKSAYETETQPRLFPADSEGEKTVPRFLGIKEIASALNAKFGFEIIKPASEL